MANQTLRLPGNPPTLLRLVDNGDGTHSLATVGTVATGDIEIGAVELKDGTTDTRAVIDANGLDVDVTRLPAVAIDQTTDGTTNKVNTELPAARLAADTLALPTAPDVLATLAGYNGGTLDLVRAGTLASDALSIASKGHLQIAGYNLLFNLAGGNWDRQRGNAEGTLLASAARTATTNSADITNHNARGVRVRFNVSALAASPSITVAIQEKDALSGNYVTLLTSAAIVATGQKTTLVVFPGAVAVANAVLGEPLPRTWRISVIHSNADSITYSADYALII